MSVSHHSPSRRESDAPPPLYIHQVSISQSDSDPEERDPSDPGALRPLHSAERTPADLAAAVIKNCTFQSTCLRFKSALGLPGESGIIIVMTCISTVNKVL